MPLSNEDLESLRLPMRNLKIICGAMIGGVTMFGILLCTIVNVGQLNMETPMLVMMAAGFGAVMYMSSFVAFKVLSSQTHAKTGSVKSHFGVLQSAWIVRYALIEGAVFMNLIVTMLETSMITAFVALLGLLFMLIGFPMPMKVESLLEDRMRDA